MTERTDPSKLYDLKRAVEDHHLFGPEEVDDFAPVYFGTKGKQEQLQPLLDSVVDRYELRPKRTARISGTALSGQRGRLTPCLSRPRPSRAGCAFRASQLQPTVAVYPARRL